MKTLFNIFFVIGVALLFFAAVGVFSDNPSRVNNIKVTSVLVAANTVFLLAIISKLCQAK